MMGQDTKVKEGRESTFSLSYLVIIRVDRLILCIEHGATGQSDMRMNSSDVSAVVSVPKPGKERIHTGGKA